MREPAFDAIAPPIHKARPRIDTPKMRCGGKCEEDRDRQQQVHADRLRDNLPSVTTPAENRESVYALIWRGLMAAKRGPFCESGHLHGFLT